MKKFVILLLSLLMLISVFGCKNPGEPTKEEKAKLRRIAVFKKDETDSGLVLFMDDDHDVLYQKEIVYPLDCYIDDTALYYSYDGEVYESIVLSTMNKGATISGVDSLILAVNQNGDFVTYQFGTVTVHKHDGTIEEKQIYISGWFETLKNRFYMMDSSNNLYIFNQDDFSLISVSRVSNSYINRLMIADGKVCLVNDYGIAPLSDEGVDITYTYNVGFEDIGNILRDCIYLGTNGDFTCYKVSFKPHQLVLEPMLDESYYGEVRYEQVFAEYYENNYTICQYYILTEVNYGN